MEVVRDRLGDLLEKLRLEGETLSQDELLEYKSKLMDEYLSISYKCENSDKDLIQVLLLLIDKYLKLD
jgi:hypothetical protein